MSLSVTGFWLAPLSKILHAGLRTDEEETSGHAKESRGLSVTQFLNLQIPVRLSAFLVSLPTYL